MPTLKQQKVSKNTISACIVTYHDQDSIERCLKSIKTVVDEIIVVHDGPCQDNTLKIAKKYTDKAFEGPRLGNPEPHRVTTFKKAKGNWILIIDADEFLSEEAQHQLRRLVNSNQAEQYNFLWKIWDGQQYLTQTWPYRICLVKKSKLRFLAILHPDWSIKGKMLNVPFHLEHQPNYNNLSLSSFRSKWTKWMGLHAQQITTPINQIPQFQFDDNHFVKHIEWIKKYDVWISPFIFVYFLLGSLALSPKFESWVIYKFAVFQALYYFLLCFAVRQAKQARSV